MHHPRSHWSEHWSQPARHKVPWDPESRDAFLSRSNTCPASSQSTRSPCVRQAAPRCRQNGFKDEITFSGPGGVDVNVISLWDNKASAEAYTTNGYPEVLKAMARFIEGTPKVQTSDVVHSTFHQITVQAAA